MRKSLCVGAFTLLVTFASAAFGQLSITSPTASNARVSFASDYATEVLGNPWDMDSINDLAEFIPNADYGSGITERSSMSFSNGILSFDISSADNAYFHLLSPGQSSTNPLGKNGQNLPIDSTKYRYLTIRMNVSVSAEMRVHWNTGTNYATSFRRTEAIPTVAGWRTYVVDLETVASTGTGESRGWSEAKNVTGLRFEPGYSGSVQIDWITLTAEAPETYTAGHSFAATGNNTRYSLFVDDDNNPFNGYVDQLVKAATATTTATINPRKLFPGGFVVNGYTSDDFAILRGNPWDFSDKDDYSFSNGITGETLSGGKLSGTVANINGGADAYVHMNLFSENLNASQYRYLTFDLNVSTAGSGAVYWFNTAGTLAGSYFYGLTAGDNRVTVDLGSQSGWSGEIGTLRIFFHNKIGTTFSLDYVSLRETNQSITNLSTPTVSSSSGTLYVNAPPKLTMLQPDARGGADYAATVLGNPWNMDSLDDIESVSNLTSASIMPNNYVNGRQGDFFCGLSENGNDDPYQTSLKKFGTNSGKLDATRYRNVTIEAYVARQQDVTNGSVLRIIGWNHDRDGKPLNGDDTIIQSGEGAEWFTMTQDMTKFKLEPLIHTDGGPDPAWDGMMDLFRIDVHEFSEPTTYCIDSIEVRADDEANSQFALAFDVSDADHSDSNLQVSFYYNSTESTSGGTAIVTDLSLERNSRVYLWDTSLVPAGTYWVYGVLSDGKNTHTQMAHRIVIDHTLTEDTTQPTLELDSLTDGQEFFKTLYVEGYAIDNTQIALVEVLADDKLLGSFQPSIFHKGARAAFPTNADASRSGFRESVSIESLSVGTHSLEVKAWDTAGNSTSKTFSITRSSGNDPARQDPTPENEEALNVPLTGTTTIAYKLKVNTRKKKIVGKIQNADRCSQIDLVAYIDGDELEANPSIGTPIASMAVSNRTVKISSKNLKPLKKDAAAGNGPLYIGLLCDGELQGVKRALVNKIKKGKKIKTWQEYLPYLETRMKLKGKG